MGVSTLDKHIGERFGYLIVTDVIRKNCGSYNQTYFVVKCDCGNTKEIRANYVKKKAISCGCKTNELKAKGATKHGMSGTRLYGIHEGMIARCYNENNCRYSRYGGRGISMCDNWRNDFMNFYNWSMSNGYKDDLTIERIDINGNYEPNNCKWIPPEDQHKNKTFERGSARWMSKLKESDIPEIRFLLSKGYSHTEIGEMYNVSRQVIGKIKNKETWRHVK